MSLLLLPVVYAGTMVAFTAMRKVKLERYLKGHSNIIALGVGLTIVLPLLVHVDKVKIAEGKLYALVLFLQGAIFSLAMMQRNEFSGQDFAWVVGSLGLNCALAAFNAAECDRYASLVMFLVSMLNLLIGIGNLRGTDDKKKRIGAMLTVTSVWGVLAVYFCESSAEMSVLYTVTGLLALLVAKINHPVLGDSLSPETTTVDPENSAWKM